MNNEQHLPSRVGLRQRFVVLLDLRRWPSRKRGVHPRQLRRMIDKHWQQVMHSANDCLTATGTYRLAGDVLSGVRSRILGEGF